MSYEVALNDGPMVRVECTYPHQRLAAAMVRLAIDDGDAAWLASDDALVWLGLVVPADTPIEGVQRAVIARARRP